ncbi:hypothetical protein ZOSMA_393G00020 [Zostera marina]|uniref:FAR1 domain-containing protein n=1 Tax=Zostera marina TaxID=29655 RepID=A0A0K9P6M1_ZOSMR|nr:hypothetical protein ZOSMA_393G00020 [Zostera marina]
MPNANYVPHHNHDTPLDNLRTPISSENNDLTGQPNAITSSVNASPSFFVPKKSTDTNSSSDNVKLNSPPTFGQFYSSYSVALDQYYDYASKMGFSVRLGSTNYKTSKDDGKKYLVMRRLLCSKERTVDLLHPLKLGKRRKNAISRCSCASIKIKRKGMSEVWIVNTIIPSSHHQKLLFQSLSEVNVPSSQQTAYFSTQVGGIEHMRCTQLDISNMCRDDRIDLKNYDVDLLVEEFEMKKFVQLDFFYSIVKDSSGRLKYVFWVDSIMIQHFKLFGDAITFDTTYKTNVYSLIFGMFCEVNHHRKTVIFGSAFLR